MPQDDDTPRSYASPPCYAKDIDPSYGGAMTVNPQDAAEVALWRKAERKRLLAERAALSVAVRQAAAETIAGRLDRLLASRFATLDGLTLSAWWPIKAELNLRHWLEALIARGAQVALPVVITPATPLVFRLWTPDCKLVQGFWKIPIPADGREVVPDVALAPVVGWDAAGYRLGYGGGYFDRTLAALHPRAFAIGVGLEAAKVETIFPQPHDIAMNAIVTETQTSGNTSG